MEGTTTLGVLVSYSIPVGIATHSGNHSHCGGGRTIDGLEGETSDISRPLKSGEDAEWILLDGVNVLILYTRDDC